MTCCFGNFEKITIFYLQKVVENGRTPPLVVNSTEKLVFLFEPFPKLFATFKKKSYFLPGMIHCLDIFN